jgi:DNA polymerase-1
MGDASDNIPGAPGVGEKTAMKLIESYHSIDNVFANTASLKGKLQEIITNNQDKIILSKQLATIATDVPLQVTDEELVMSTTDVLALKALFEKLNFKTLERRVLGRVSGTTTSPAAIPVPSQNLLFDLPPAIETKPMATFKTINDTPHEYVLADTPQKIDALIQALSALKEFCFDTETTGLNVNQSQLVGMSFAWEKSKAWYLPIPANQEDAKILVLKFKPVLENSSIRKIGQNIKFDILILRNYLIEVKGEVFDTMLAHYLLQPEQRHNMNFLSETYLNYSPVPIEELIGPCVNFEI